jgi:hypothetical protein
MKETCRNCGELSTHEYCRTCGQKKYRRIDRKYVIEEFEYATIHLSKGLFYSIVCLLKNPGKTAREYLNGKRVNHYKPIVMAFVLSGFVGLLYYWFIDKNKIVTETVLVNESQPLEFKKFFNVLINFILKNYGWITLLSIPFFALISKRILRKQPENYFEHFVLNSYIQCLFAMLSLFTFPLVLLFRNSSNVLETINIALQYTLPLVMIWFFKTYYTKISLINIVLKVLLMLLIGIVFSLLIVLVISIILFKTGLISPERLSVS